MGETWQGILDRCAGAYAPSTIRGYGIDYRIYENWCEPHDLAALPSRPESVAAFVEQQAPALAINTLKRRVVAIGFVHRMGGYDDPTVHPAVKLAVRRAKRLKNRRPAQAKGLTAGILDQIVEAGSDTLAAVRDAALISVGYDTLCRSSELVAMRYEHLERGSEGDWKILVPKSKADPEGSGRVAWLSPRTRSLLGEWLHRTGIEEGLLFRGLHLGKLSSALCETASVRRLVKRAARNAAVPANIVAGLSGHSMRVGAAQDMLLAGFDSLAIMQAGGWKTQHVVLRYLENAETHQLQRRDGVVWVTVNRRAPKIEYLISGRTSALGGVIARGARVAGRRARGSQPMRAAGRRHGRNSGLQGRARSTAHSEGITGLRGRRR